MFLNGYFVQESHDILHMKINFAKLSRWFFIENTAEPHFPKHLIYKLNHQSKQ